MTEEQMRRMASDITDLKVMVARIEERVANLNSDIEEGKGDRRQLWDRLYTYALGAAGIAYALFDYRSRMP